MPTPPSSPELDALLARRPAELHWLDPTALSGFFFAVAAAPELIEPGEWMEMVFGEDGPDAESMAELSAAVETLFAIYAEAAAMARTYDEPGLPAWIEVRPVPVDNLGGDAPLATWSRGFAYGHSWLEELWDVPLPDDLDRQFGSVFACLVLFGLDDELGPFMRRVFPGTELPELAATCVQMFAEAIQGYARMGEVVEEFRTQLVEDDGDPEAAGAGFTPQAVGRDEPCPCGSGLKYMRCCGKAVH
jgi:uncharacterized protein